MKTPPFLLGGALLFWGWQTGFLIPAAVMAVVLEGARLVKARWDFSDDDFSRIWTLCTLLFLGVAIYAFTDNGGPAKFSNFLQNPAMAGQTSLATARTASTMLRWLPFVLFLFVAAQLYSTREEIPVATISLILRRRWKKAAQRGLPIPRFRGFNVAYPYFAMCLFAASVHPSDNNSYFWGLCVLVTWALWVQRTRRFGLAIWLAALMIALFAGYFGQMGIGRVQAYLQNLDPQWLERFMKRGGTDPTQSRTQIGHIGRVKLSGKIVIRVEPNADSVQPEYLREASYRFFVGDDLWKAGSTRESFQNLPAETNNGAYILVQKTTFNQARITCYLDQRSRESGSPMGLLPLPTGSGRLENVPIFVLKMNSLGAVLAEGPGLVTFDAHYGPGVTLDDPFNPGESQNWTNFNRYRSFNGEAGTHEVFTNINPDLFIHPRETNMLNGVVSGWNVQKGDRVAAMRAIRNFFTNFSYSTWQDMPEFSSTNQTALGFFLQRTRRGHCEYFATATVLLLRQLGVPARYAVGYAVHEKSGKEYVVRLRDAHAWCLVWNEKSKQWQDFDMTPASWVEEEGKNASVFQSLSDFWSWLGFHWSKFRWGQSNIRQYMIFSLVPLLCFLAYQIFFRRKKKRKDDNAREDFRPESPGLDSEFYLIEKKLAQRGILRHPNEALSDWLKRALQEPSLSSAGDPLGKLLLLHYRYRFDPKGLTSFDREQLRIDAAECIRQLETEKSAVTV